MIYAIVFNNLACATEADVKEAISESFIRLMFVNQYWNSTEEKIVYSVDSSYILYIDALGFADMVVQIIPNEVIYSKITINIYTPV